jgi:hypothetical protein
VNAGVIVLVTLAAGYVLLAGYGKYRRIKEEFERAKEEQARGDGSETGS